MSHPVPPQPSVPDAARSESPPAPRPDAPPAEFPPHDARSPHWPIEREIERSERASAALAATRALARAAFTDSELAAEDAAAEHGGDPSSWVRTEYAALDHPIRDAEDAPAAPPARNLVGGSFNPGIATQHGRAFPGLSIAHTPITTRTGAQARFMQESRRTPRGERPSATASPHDHAAGAANYDKPATMPVLAPVAAAGPARAPTAAPVRMRGAASEPMKLLMAAGVGLMIAFVGGGAAWKAGLLAPRVAAVPPSVSSQVAAQAEAARALAPSQPEITIAPAAGPTPARSDAEVNAALAAAARAAAVPAASVRAVGPAPVVRAPEAVAPVAATPPAPAAPHAAPHKDSVADAIAAAQARADKFLAASSAPAPAAPEPKPDP